MDEAAAGKGFEVKVERETRPVLIRRHDAVIASTERAFLVTGDGPVPVYYVPQADVYMEHLVEVDGGTHQRSGMKTRLWSITASGGGVEKAAWMFVEPPKGCEDLAGCIGFEPDPFNITAG